jgi:nucleoside 2-deoxyribosyltransferase
MSETNASTANPTPKLDVKSATLDPPLRLILLALLFGFTLQSAMDHFLSRLEHYPTGSALWAAVSNDPARKILLFLQFIVFVFTVIRFYLGAYTYGIESTDESPLETIINSIGTFLLFATFYVTSFTLRDVDLFYWLVGLFLSVDFIWFLGVGFLLSLPKSMALVIRVWQWFDLATLVIIAVSMLALHQYLAQYVAICGIGAVGLMDMVCLRKFYDRQPDWAENTFPLKRPAGEDQMKKIVVFGPLFTQAERLWNRMLKKAIEEKGRGEWEVILPQDQAEKFIHGADIDRDSIAQDCFERAEAADLAIAILDGADADSGTCIEIAWRKGKNIKSPVIGVRTDFRAGEDQGSNLMLRRGKTIKMCDAVVDFPSFNEDIAHLAEQILVEALKLLPKK